MEPSEQSSTLHYTAQNRRAWDEIAEVRHTTMWPDAEFFANGGSLLDAETVAAAGDVIGRSLLHLQCATGEDTLSWAVLGARATGVDLSPRQVELAQAKADAAGLSVQFIAADVYQLPEELQQESFDMVVTGGGALVWLPDLPGWARIVTRALRPGGRLLLSEEHPVTGCLWVSDGTLTLESDYFGRKAESGVGWGHFSGGEDAREEKYEFAWPLGDVITAVAGAGLRIESLAEYPSDSAWRFGDQLEAVRTLPGRYVLVAVKE